MKKNLLFGMFICGGLLFGCENTNNIEPVENDTKEVEEIEIPSFENETEKEETKYDLTVEEFLPIIENHYMELDNVLKVDYNSFECPTEEADYCTDTNVSAITVDITLDIYNISFDYADSVYYAASEADKIEMLKGFMEQVNTTLNTLYETTGFDDYVVFSWYAKDHTLMLSVSSDVDNKEVKQVENFEVTNNGYSMVSYSANELINYSSSNDDLEGWDESWSQHEYCTDANGNVDYCADIEAEEDNTAEDNRTSDWEQYGFRYWTNVVEFDRSSESGLDFDWEREMRSIGESAFGYEYIMFTYSDSCAIVTNEPDPNYFFVTLEEAEQWRN